MFSKGALPIALAVVGGAVVLLGAVVAMQKPPMTNASSSGSNPPVLNKPYTGPSVWAVDRSYSVNELGDEPRAVILVANNLAPQDQKITLLCFSNETSPDRLSVVYDDLCAEGALVRAYDALPKPLATERGTLFSTVLCAFEKRAKEGCRRFVLVTDGGLDYEDYAACRKAAQNLARYDGLKLWVVPVDNGQLNLLQFNALQPLYQANKLVVTLRGSDYEAAYDNFMQ